MYFLIPFITTFLIVSAWMPSLVNRLPVVKLAQPTQIRTVVNAVNAFSQVYSTLSAMAADGTLKANPNTAGLSFPAVDATAPDGGAASMAAAFSEFEPPALKGFTWVYGQHPVDNSVYSGRYYFCMEPISGEFVSPSALSAVVAAYGSFTGSDYVYNTSCGALTSNPNVSSAAVHLTYYPPVYVAPSSNPSQRPNPPGGQGKSCHSKWDRTCGNPNEGHQGGGNSGGEDS